MSGSGCTNFSPECTIVDSFYAYVPSLIANAAFAAIFGISLVLHLIQGIRCWKAWKGFAVAMVVGNFAEVIGYIGRILNHKNPFNQNGFLIQICCITIAPAFLSAGVYFCLGAIVRICDPSISRIPPRFYAYIFIPCDLISLILQAIGGAMASIATTNLQSPDKGDNIMIAGVSFQVFTLSIFILLSGDYALRVRRSKWAVEEERESMTLASENFLKGVVKLNKKLGLDKWNTVDTAVIDSRGVDREGWSEKEKRSFQVFLWALGISTIAIFIRCIYRVVEMSYGWSGVIIANQRLFIGFEGVCISIAVLILNIFHPGHCLKTPSANEHEIISQHENVIERRMTEEGDTSCESHSTHTIEKFKSKSLFSRLRGNSNSNRATNVETQKSGVLLRTTTLPNAEPDVEKNLAEESQRRPLSLGDILKESRISDAGSTASVEGWVGQNLRDSIMRTSFSKEKSKAEGVSGRTKPSLKSQLSVEQLSGELDSFHTSESQ